MAQTRLAQIANHLRSIFDTESAGRVILYSPLVGAVVGLGAAAFFFLLGGVQHLAMGMAMGYSPPAAGTEPAAETFHPPDCWWFAR